jgi:hypothetical protein
VYNTVARAIQPQEFANFPTLSDGKGAYNFRESFTVLARLLRRLL